MTVGLEFGGHPQGVPLRDWNSEGAHKGCPYDSLNFHPSSLISHSSPLIPLCPKESGNFGEVDGEEGGGHPILLIGEVYFVVTGAHKHLGVFDVEGLECKARLASSRIELEDFEIGALAVNDVLIIFGPLHILDGVEESGDLEGSVYRACGL